ncbi:MAG TPA: DUF4397 domain-containing protein [Puia sp.]|nr:DUF4397 domain-containing protein [Puia sp.]
MKKTSDFRRLLTSAALLVLVAQVTSCKKNNVDEYGTIEIKVINASPNSPTESFTLANSLIVSGGLNFTNASNYIQTNSGSRLVAEFRDVTTNSVYASSELWFLSSLKYTIYLAGEGQNARVVYFADDLSSPQDGKAKVKFVHLSDGAPSTLTIKDGSGNDLVTSLGRNNASAFKNLAPGTITLQIYDSSQGTSVGSFTLPAVTAGSIYAVYVTGSSTSDINVHEILLK